MRALCLLLTFLGVAGIALASPRPPMGPVKGVSSSVPANAFKADLLSKCELEWTDAVLDHFSWAVPDGNRTTFRQRYFVCGADGWRSGGPIFFYLGNEADVTLYLNATGLMWESAPQFGALLVFAEHRYYGESKPDFGGDDIRQHMQYLSADQAMADYAVLITKLKEHLRSQESAVIGFGGSYGGMLASWFRMKYPHLLDGAIASSAPIWSFYNLQPAYNDKSFAQIVTRDASEAGGANPACSDNLRKAWGRFLPPGSTMDNLRKAWAALFALGKHAVGREAIAKAMRLCDGASLSNENDVYLLAQWAQEAFDYMAMGNYPYTSPYILNGLGELPAFPVRVACESLGRHNMEGADLLQGLAGAVSVFYNYSGGLECLDYTQGVNNATSEDGEFWWYQSCTEQPMPFSRDGVEDAFWNQPNDKGQTGRDCQQQWGVTPRNHWPATQWGGRDISRASNIVFANGYLDPWSGGGVLEDINDSVKAVIIPEGAHHLDLFFSHPKDPQSVRDARALQRREMRRWIRQRRRRLSHAARGRRSSSGTAAAAQPLVQEA